MPPTDDDPTIIGPSGTVLCNQESALAYQLKPTLVLLELLLPLELLQLLALLRLVRLTVSSASRRAASKFFSNHLLRSSK
jgi:hypothetical protein